MTALKEEGLVGEEGKVSKTLEIELENSINSMKKIG